MIVFQPMPPAGCEQQQQNFGATYQQPPTNAFHSNMVRMWFLSATLPVFAMIVLTINVRSASDVDSNLIV